MVGECSICPIDWDDYYENVEMALKTIWDSNLDDVVKERLEELLRVDTINAYPKPIQSWDDTKGNIDGICPVGASVPEVDWLRGQVDKLCKGTAL